MSCSQQEGKALTMTVNLPSDPTETLRARAEQIIVTRSADAAEQERDEAKRTIRIMDLSVPLEEDLTAKIDEMCKYLAMEDGFTLNGIARLLIECQRRMAADWVTIGSERRSKHEAEARADAAEQERDAFMKVALINKAEAEKQHAAVETLRQERGWQPIETYVVKDEAILRPHRIWGAMDVRYKETPTTRGDVWHWVNGDYTTAWPDEAFLPFWMSLPDPPGAEGRHEP